MKSIKYTITKNEIEFKIEQLSHNPDQICMCSLFKQICDQNNVPLVVIFDNKPEYRIIIEKLKRHYVFEKWVFDWDNCVSGYSRGVMTDNIDSVIIKIINNF